MKAVASSTSKSLYFFYAILTTASKNSYLIIPLAGLRLSFDFRFYVAVAEVKTKSNSEDCKSGPSRPHYL